MKEIKICGYLLNFVTGEYSNRQEETWWFKKIPNFKKIKMEIDKAWRKDVGDYKGNMPVKIAAILEKHGGKTVKYMAEIWTDDYGTSEIEMNNLITREEFNWDKK